MRILQADDRHLGKSLTTWHRSVVHPMTYNGKDGFKDTGHKTTIALHVIKEGRLLQCYL